MRIKKDDVAQKLSFVAFNSSDHVSRKPALSSFTVYYSLNGGTATVMTTPTVAELDATNMTGDYTILVDEAGMVSAVGELTISITASGMDPVTRTVEITDNFESDIASDVWDEILTGATHNISTSAGRRVREIAGIAIHTGTTQAGTATTITLAAAANGGDGVYNRNLIVILAGTGQGQTRTIVEYTDSTKLCVIDREWRITPDATSEYQILADDTPLVVDHGVAQAGSTSTTIKLRAYASAIDDNYLCNIVTIIAGTGRGQARLVGSYDGTSKVVTICGNNWGTTPDDTSVYTMIPYGASCASCMADNALSQINTEMGNVLNTAIPGSPTADSINAQVKALPSGITKNVALSNIDIYMVLSSDHVSSATSKTVTGTISKDGGSFASLTSSVSEVANGMYKVNLTQTEMNADVIVLIFTAVGCDQRVKVMYTS